MLGLHVELIVGFNVVLHVGSYVELTYCMPFTLFHRRLCIAFSALQTSVGLSSASGFALLL